MGMLTKPSTGLVALAKDPTAKVSASVYTQITDVELECDGFLNYDRSDKFTADEVESVRAANAALIAQAAGL